MRSVHVQDETVYQDVVEPKKKRGQNAILLKRNPIRNRAAWIFWEDGQILPPRVQ